ncbi:Smr/MutS family protein [bacterium]|nr:Smr/MutS family protein [bacterium]
MKSLFCYDGGMKQLSDADIQKMADAPFAPDTRAVNRSVRRQLRLGQLIPPPAPPVPRVARLDLHRRTEEQAWAAINALATSGVRRAVIITGASGILKIKFQQWVTASTLADRIVSCTPINNGSFDVQFRRPRRPLAPV